MQKVTSLRQKILWTFFPKEYLILVMVGIVLLMMGSGFNVLGGFFINIVTMLVGVRIAVIIHETGHLICAKVVGGTPRRMILGRGFKVIQTEFMGVKILLNTNLNSGLAYAAFDDLKFIKWKLAFFTLGGILTNFLVGGLLIFLFIGIFDILNPVLFFGYANLLVGIFALIPFYIKYQGLKIPTDGLSLLKIPSYDQASLVAHLSVNELLDAYDLYEDKNFEASIIAYQNYQAKNEQTKSVNIMLSMAHLKLGNYETSTQLMEELLPLIEEPDFISSKGIIYNGLAWNYLLLNRLEEAEKYSKLAFENNPAEVYIRGTRASVLIENEQFERGKKLLIQDVNFSFPNSQTLTAAIYLALAYTKLDNPKKASTYLQFAEDNLQELDKDELLLYNRVKQKIATNN